MNANVFSVAVGVSLGRKFVLLAVAISLVGCTQLPRGIQPVDEFDIDRYLGTWYEIARLDHRFERGLDKVTANYALRNDGGIDVINRGFSSGDQTWKEAQGKAYFVGDSATGHLKVSFFGPFYSSYVVFELDKTDYEYAFVCGYSRDYLWLLARRPSVDEEIIERFLKRSRSLDFDTDEIIFVSQDPTAEALQYDQ
ncbi:MAG: lipocalin [gamma proteobacterium symbiont of Ctena orbiculata]|uniref:Outer membrane lipoprotein Blc n=1 Tax=Candidatus Thiodiazotropha taylori TaxID=2792791 RepID=A0A944QW55_9GAMM|nr:lipocalin family protein [Candidatus Thiodiazotropha taylori]PUB84761.1 MAG: lipocalin [gamma proteobacterium symbiont of Ctena orbiculata]MBT2990001.1 lipocalin family protein [Candidatus Thiodiazotropha taylori]MBT2998276.1 lipocalin family protein [Candidatus Thiodiazotropha taylori]MBT3002613.1 lipocalin family protein [Candidatus Thiodiazotropha taylori]